MSVKSVADQLNGNAVQPTAEKAKSVTADVVTTVSTFIEDALLPNISKIQAVLLAGLALGQEIMKRNARKASKAQETVASTAAASLHAAQDVAQSGLSTTQDVLQENVKHARKNLKKAQKSMKVAQKAAATGATAVLSKTQDVLQSGLSTAGDMLPSNLVSSQNALQKNVKRARKNLKKASESVGESLEDVGEAVQHKTSSFLFRVGIVTGLVLVLLYTPWPGSETRAKLADLFQRAKQNLSNLTSGS
ncbi:MAG TPA: hypothetical protein VKV40_15030 [Ktedonobacteraceae bacterium]|nr:hypothetical protein [Ktedonobacteraceae bacterium]